MYPGKTNSPETRLAEAVTDVATTIRVLDASVLPAAPNVMTLGRGATAETVRYPTDAVANVFSDVVRAHDGTASAWDANTPVARRFTADDFDALQDNITDLDGRIPTELSDFTDCEITTPTEGQFLRVNASGVVVNETVDGGTGEFLDVVGTAANSDLLDGMEAAEFAYSDLSNVDLTGLAAGDLLYFNGTVLVRLALGSNGQVLKSNGTAPYWSAP
jgi:hypothetical protein